MGEKNDGRAIDRAVMAFARPCAHLLSVRWIAKNRFGAPVLAQTILLFREKLFALRVEDRCARVKREVELVVEKSEKVGWGRPLF
jgi:hypothetical protein